MWKDIDSAPKDKPLILAVDSYDCGWVFDAGFYDDGKWKIPYVDGEHFNHMRYSHYLDDPSQLKWSAIPSIPKHRVALLGRKNANGEMEICFALEIFFITLFFLYLFIKNPNVPLLIP